MANLALTAAAIDAALKFNGSASWMHYGAFTNTLASSFNVSTVTDSATGVFLQNFTSIMTTAFHSPSGSQNFRVDVTDANLDFTISAATTTGTQRVRSLEGGVPVDSTVVSVQIHNVLA